MFFSKQDWYHMDLWLLQDHIPSFDNLITRGEPTLDDYDIMDNNQNLYVEYERHFHFRNLTVELYSWPASFRETLLAASAVVKWDGRAFGAFPGCVTRCFTLTSGFLPPRPAKVMIYATWCRRFLSFFLHFGARNKSWDMWGHENREKKCV